MKSEGHPKYQLYAHPVSEQHSRTFTDYWWAYIVRGTPQISFWCSACTRVTSVIHGLLVGIYEVRGDTQNISCMPSLYQNNTGHSHSVSGQQKSGGHPKYQFYAECVSE